MELFRRNAAIVRPTASKRPVVGSGTGETEMLSRPQLMGPLFASKVVSVKRSVVELEAAAKTNVDRKSTRLNSSHIPLSRMPSSA